MLKFLRYPLELSAIAVGIGGVLVLLYAWHLPPFDTSVQTTDNAYVRGFTTVVSPQVSGYVTAVLVKDYEKVEKGQTLAKIDDRIYVQRLAQAQATLASQKAALLNSQQQELSARASIVSKKAQIDSAKAAEKRTELSWNRIQNLVSQHISATSDAEGARAALDEARAAVTQTQSDLEVATQNLAAIIVNRGSLEAAVTGAEAAVKLADIDLQHTSIQAATTGRLGEVGVRLGQYVTAGTQLVALVPSDVWVIANFKETQLLGMKIGQPVRFSVDALGHAELSGRIESFSPAAGSEFAVIRPDNATGNFTKVAQRVGVRVAVDKSQTLAGQLSPGFSVVVSVDTAAAPEIPLASN